MSVRKTNEAEAVEVCGKPFHCTACGNDRFQRRKALLNTSWATLFNLDWATARPSVSSAPDAATSTGSSHLTNEPSRMMGFSPSGR
jgi:hypothetical protein